MAAESTEDILKEEIEKRRELLKKELSRKAQMDFLRVEQSRVKFR
jgi:hypothetical protein